MISRRAAAILSDVRKNTTLPPPIQRRTLDPLAAKLLKLPAPQAAPSAPAIDNTAALLAMLEQAEAANSQMHEQLANAILTLGKQIKANDAAKPYTMLGDAIVALQNRVKTLEAERDVYKQLAAEKSTVTPHQ